ncbi:HAMP domain-containing histidine kinase [Chroococcidiopsis sp. FACHB-1243]|uniref:sensor histidine kinase n=1 Tax=Chroococcidiopsis sp. [FACHB-1243] TaxID=2692781 RepID=UPI00178477B3|nr:HAMP domain-containing sensor histidine kinase [Chroococcidiopsis sp. [FACHB-1243]]MBD2305307.1 HAMP domain-containing histidine kinase [Chroococcidiopsis sp. [FACHB-1243]]
MWTLPTIREIITKSRADEVGCYTPELETEVIRHTSAASKRLKVVKEWSAAIAALEQLLLDSLGSPLSNSLGFKGDRGIVLAGPAPILSQKELLANFQTGVFTAEWLKLSGGRPFQLPPAATKSDVAKSQATSDPLPVAVEIDPPGSTTIPLLPGDPLAKEQFCLVLTDSFSLVMVAGVDGNNDPVFMFAFEPEIVAQAWQTLRARVALTSSRYLLLQLDAIAHKYAPVAPDYRIVAQFSRLLLKHLPEPEEGQGDNAKVKSQKSKVKSNDNVLDFQLPTPDSRLPTPHSRPDLELLQAFAHEVRTPLTTIRTLIRLLLKRRDLSSDVQKRLEAIEHECREQIDRMELMFQAAELETSASDSNNNNYLIATSLEQLLQQSIPRWQHSAKRRSMTLDVILPQQMPTVISHPSMLDRVLTGLIENFTRSLPAGSQIQVQVIPAGDQLKLQLFSQLPGEDDEAAQSFSVTSIGKSLGQLLTFQPETGCISLNLNATKHLFQSIGGKLIVRQKPQQGEVLTVFLPLFGSGES